MYAFFLAMFLVIVVAAWRKRPGVRKRRWTRDVWKPGRKLVPWSKKSAFCCQDSYSHTLILGGTGSGKSSGSGRTIAESMLRAGYGGLVLLVKDDRTFWEGLCRQTKRSRDLIKFSPSQNFAFNFLDHELHRSGRGAGQTENIVEVLFAAMETADRNSGQDGGREDATFWRQACKQLCRNLVDLASMSLGRINIRELYEIVASTADSIKEVQSDEWAANSFCARCLNDAVARVHPSRRGDLKAVGDYFFRSFPKLAPNTRGSVKATFTVVADSLQRGVLPRLFCEKTNITPEATENGNIILVDMPIIEFGAVGMLAAGLWKYAFQKSIERRNLRKSPRPVFLWIDEAQYLLTANDYSFLSTCRSSRVATVYLTQNLSNLYAALGGRQKAEAEVDSLCGNFCTKIFHANGDSLTNKWAAEAIGRSRQFLVNASNSQQTGGWLAGYSGYVQGPNTSAGVTEHIDFEVEPSAFTRLRTGGPANKRYVDAIVVKNEPFPDTRRTWRLATFRQKR